MENILEVRNLRTYFDSNGVELKAVDDVSFSVKKGETLGIVGESGCGKSVTCMSVVQLNPKRTTKYPTGSILLNGRDVLKMNEKELQKMRGGEVSVIFQEPMTALNPLFTVGDQLMEAVMLHGNVKKRDAWIRCVDFLKKVRIPSPEKAMKRYPFTLSGGMRQRVMIAMALVTNPQLLIADEPTTALDVTIQAQILELINELKQETQSSCIFITHDLGVISEMADRIMVMYGGHICEIGTKDEVLNHPLHPYTVGLIHSRPTPDYQGDRLQMIPGNVPSLKNMPSGCPFHTRCQYATQQCREQFPKAANEGEHQVFCWNYRQKYQKSEQTVKVHIKEKEINREKKDEEIGEKEEKIVAVKNLKKLFPVRTGLFSRTRDWVHAVDGVSFEIPYGKTLGLVGESGCGKSTVGKLLLGLEKPTEGTIRFEGQDVENLREGETRELYRRRQMVFQDPFSSMDPRKKVYDIVGEGLEAFRVFESIAKRKKAVEDLLLKCGLFPDQADRFPHQFSGGQRQRICIARALAIHPKFIVCDEAVSALDVSIQAQIINLLKDIQEELSLTYLFISHDLNVVRFISDEVAVMYLGQVVEYGTKEQIFKHHQHPYTQALLAAAPSFGTAAQGKRVLLGGDIPSPINPPKGCRFAERCPYAQQKCFETEPKEREIEKGHRVKCHMI